MGLNQAGRHAPAFPPDPPPDLSDPAAIQYHDWSAFRSVQEMTNHWDRPGWSSQRRSYHWLIPFQQETELHSLAARCQRELAPLSLDPVPEGSLHMTLMRIGFLDELGTRDIDAVACSARKALAEVPSFELTVGPLAGSRGAVRFSVSPWGQLDQLHARTHLATASVLGGDSLAPRGRFRPHISIAYSNQNRPAGPVIAAVAGLRSLPTIRVRVHELSLVVLRREDRAYRWETVENIGLEGQVQTGEC